MVSATLDMLESHNFSRWIAVRIQVGVALVYTSATLSAFPQVLSSAFAGGLCYYLVYGPGHETRTASNIGFLLNMAGTP
jgi:hypothetical protein